MDSLHRLALLPLLVFLLHSSVPSRATADELPPRRIAVVAGLSDDPVLGIAGTGTVQYAETPAPPVPRECTGRYMAGPAVGLVAGPSAMVGGVFLIGDGVGLNDSDGVDLKTRRDRGMQAAGGIMMVAGLGAFLYSIGKLVINRHERRRVCNSDDSQSVH